MDAITVLCRDNLVGVGKTEGGMSSFATVTESSPFDPMNPLGKDDLSTLFGGSVVAERAPAFLELGLRHADSVVRHRELFALLSRPNDVDLRGTGIVSVGDKFQDGRPGFTDDLPGVILQETVSEHKRRFGKEIEL